MLKHMLMKGIIGLSITVVSLTTFAASIEGYWKTVDDQTGEQLSIVEIQKDSDGSYRGKIVYRNPNARGVTLSHCVKCPAPYTNQPILGLEILSKLKDDPNNPNNYIDGRVLEVKSGKIYKGKGKLSPDGKRLVLRGYVGVSALGRSVVWFRTDKATP